MQILSAHIKAILLSAAKKDIRYYLNGVLVNEKHIVSTDGHRMTVIAHGQEWEHGDTIIPRETLEMALKLKTKTIEITNTAVGPIAYTPLDGRFPDYKRVMPALHCGADTGEVFTQINPDYLVDAMQAIKLVTGKTGQSLALVNNVFVWSSAQTMVVVMPMRTETKGEKNYSLTPIA